MSRLIDADKLVEALDLIPVMGMKEDCGYVVMHVSLGHVLRAIDEQPTVEPGRKNGRWVAVDRRYVKCSKCSECGLETTKNELRGIALFGENEPYFCPNCGADMRGENHEQT